MHYRIKMNEYVRYKAEQSKTSSYPKISTSTSTSCNIRSRIKSNKDFLRLGMKPNLIKNQEVDIKVKFLNGKSHTIQVRVDVRYVEKRQKKA